MYLSRLLIDPVPSPALRVLGEPYGLHQVVMAAFDPTARGDSRVLYRVEPERCAGRVMVLVQSDVRPDWQRTRERFRLDGMGAQVKEFEPSLREGQRVRFRLRANPTVKRDGKRIGLFGTEPDGRDRQLEWLRTRLERAGYRVPHTPAAVRVIDEGLVRNREPRLELQSALFEGVVEIRDPEAAAKAVRAGVGPGKGFGFGLLSLAPAR